MLDRDLLQRLIGEQAKPAVSLLMPTHAAGREIRQDPIRMRRLVDRASDWLTQSGLRAAEAERLLAPARRLVSDEEFWRMQDQGLAVFLAPGVFHVLRVRVALPEETVVGTRFHFWHLLPLFDSNGAFLVLSISARRARLFEASRHGMAECRGLDLPKGVGELVAITEHQAARHAAPTARPRSGAPGGAHPAQSLGEDPDALRKTELLDYLRRVADTIERYAAKHRRLPVILAAHPEIQGHFRALSRLPTLVPEGVAENPDDLAEAALCRKAFAVAAPILAAARNQALERCRALLGDRSSRATTDLAGIVSAAREGRADTLFLAAEEHRWGTVDPDGTRIAAEDGPGPGKDDLLDEAAAATLTKRGQVHVVARSSLPQGAAIAAILRY